MFNQFKNVFWIVVLLASILVGCATEEPREEIDDAGIPMTINVSSPAFENGGSIPTQYTCDGEDISPPLEWSGLPEGTASLVLIVDDPDAPGGTWVHWVLHNIPSHLNELPEGLDNEPQLEGIGIQGTNDFDRIGYGGPCPPPGSPHRYFFKIYALDTPLNADYGSTTTEVVRVMEGHILAQGQLVGEFLR